MKDYSTSIDRELLRRMKYQTTPEQRMNWLVEAGKFVMESRKNWKRQPKDWLPRLDSNQ